MPGNVGEGAVSVVAVKDVLAVVGDEEIFKTVVVVVTHGDGAGPAGAQQACFLGHVGKRAVAIVFVEAVAGACYRVVHARSTENENVEPAVVVVVEKGDAAAHGFYNVILLREAAVDDRSG